MPPLAARPSSMASRVPFLFALFPLLLLAPLAHGAPTLGFIEHWAGTATNSWGGGSSYANPGAGGVHGPGDGFLHVSTTGPFNLGAFNSTATYSGDWIAAGITQVRFWLNDIGADEPLEIHFGIGSQTNFWQYDAGFIPPLGSWAQFSVDLTSSAAFSQILDSPGGTFAEALQGPNRILFRHDLAPYGQFPDAIQADVGVDALLLTDGIVGVPNAGPGAARPVQLALPYPNPARGPVALALQTFEDAPITIQIVDVTGRLVRQATLAASPAGSRIWTWDGTTDAGTTAPAGYYRARAFGPSGGTSRPFIRLP